MEPSIDVASIKKKAMEAERIEIVTALERTAGNISRAAVILQMSRYQLIRRIAKHNLKDTGKIRCEETEVANAVPGVPVAVEVQEVQAEREEVGNG